MDKVIKYYTKVVNDQLKNYGENDWRTVYYQEKLNRITELVNRDRETLTQEEKAFLGTASVIAEVFGK